MRVRNKVTEKEAFRCAELLHAAEKDWKNLPQAIREAYHIGGLIFGDTYIILHSSSGKVMVNSEDWLMIGLKGEMYPVTKDIFELSYEEV